MGDFKYLRNLTIGQYLPLESWLHHRDARVKLIVFFILITTVTLTKQLAGLFISMAAIFILMVLSKIPWRYALRGVLTPLPFLLFLAALQLFIAPFRNPSEPLFRIFGAGIYYEGILGGIKLLVRFIALVIVLTVAGTTISTTEIIYGIEHLIKPLKHIGLQIGSAAMTAQIAFRFIPFLAINAEKIAKAQASRGAEWGVRKGNFIKRTRQIVPLLIPLFSSSLRQAETLADAMLARGYAGNTERTSLFEFHITYQDWILLIIAVVTTALILFIQ